MDYIYIKQDLGKKNFCLGKLLVFVRFNLILLLSVLILFCPNGFVSSWQILIYF